MDLEKQKETAKKRVKELEEQIKKKKSLKSKGESKFFNFNQNNSGGHFEDDKDVCEDVIIEAYSPEDANLRADNFGIYFNGCNQGLDCSCCGDRWSEVWDDNKGTNKPEIYGKDVFKIYGESFRWKCIIHYLNGKRKKVIFKTSKDCKKHKWKQQYDIGRKCEQCHIWESEIKDAKEGESA